MENPSPPRLDTTYTDDEGVRTLLVTKIEPRNTLFRHVQGRITLADGSVHDYSTSEAIFAEIWRPV